MKKICFSLFLAAGTCGLLNAQSPVAGSFTMKGNITGIVNPADMVYLSYVTSGERKLDSISPKDGMYSFSGQLEEPVIASVFVYKMNESNRRATDAKMIFLQPGDIAVTHVDSFSNATVKGSNVHVAYEKLMEQLKPLNDKRDGLIKEYYRLNDLKDEEGKKAIVEKINAVGDEVSAEYGNYVKNNPGSPVAVYALGQYAGYDIDPDKIEPLLNQLPAELQKWPSAQKLKERTEIAKKTAIGKYAMDFTQNDTLGKPVSLSSMKGRYLLIDFWASWCGPCRVENPNVVRVFNKYKDKGFHVLGISLDRQADKEKWIKAIHDDNLTWTHVSDLQFWNNAVAAQYGIRAIPQNLLLDPEGKIIAKNLRGKDLESKLDEIFNKP